MVGESLIRRYVGFPNSLDMERDILKFLSLGGPVSCLASSTVGISVLLITGVITSSTLLFSWWTCWVGDTIGVLIFTPLMLITVAQPRNDWHHRRFTVGVPLCITFAVAVGVFFSARSWEDGRSKREFERWTTSFVQSFEDRISDEVSLLRSIEGLFLSSESKGRQEFRDFVQHLLMKHRDVQALSWNPIIRELPRARMSRFKTHSAFSATQGGLFYIEDHTGVSQALQNHIASLVYEGVFERFPTLKIVMIEGGFAWLRPLMWRLDECWRRLGEEVPHVQRPPSEYVREHIWISTQPVEEPPDPAYFEQLLDQMDMNDRVMFATDYPHWDFDAPSQALPRGLNAGLREAIMSENARKLYRLD